MGFNRIDDMWVDHRRGESVHPYESSRLGEGCEGRDSPRYLHARFLVGLVAGVVLVGVLGLGGWGFKGAWAGGGAGGGIRKAREGRRGRAKEARGAHGGIRPARGGAGGEAAGAGRGRTKLSATNGEDGAGSDATSGTGGISKRAPSLEKRTYAVASRGRWLFLATTSGLIVLKKERGKPLKRAGGVVLPDSGNDVWVERDRLFMARGAHGLVALDIKRPMWPKVLGRVDTPGAAQGVALKGRYAYVADGLGGLQVVDVKAPKRMAVVGGAKTGGYAWAVCVKGRRAYVAAGAAGLKIFDIRRPKRPRLVATVPVTVPEAPSGKAPARPRKGDALSRYVQARRLTQKFGRQARDVAPGPRGRVYVAGGTAGLLVVDIKAKTPKVVARVAVSDFARGVARVGRSRKRRVAVAHGQGGVSLVAAQKRGAYSLVASTLTKRAANEVLAVKMGRRETLVVAHDSDGVLLLQPPTKRNRGSRVLTVVGQWPAPKKKGKK